MTRMRPSFERIFASRRPDLNRPRTTGVSVSEAGDFSVKARLRRRAQECRKHAHVAAMPDPGTTGIPSQPACGGKSCTRFQVHEHRGHRRQPPEWYVSNRWLTSMYVQDGGVW